MEKYKNVFIYDHPLIKHKISILRDKNTGMKEFRELVEEITQIMTYVSMDDVQLVPVEVETPLEKTVQYRIPEESVAIVPILRAGLGMVNGVHKVFPTARVGHIGMYRNEETNITANSPTASRTRRSYSSIRCSRRAVPRATRSRR